MKSSAGSEVVVTREALRRGVVGTLLASIPAGVRVRTEVELCDSLHGMLSGHPDGEDVFVFGYGSLMWNPAVECVQIETAKVYGWHRRFCLRLMFGRGSVAVPGAMLGLDRGGSCCGVLLRISASHAFDELVLLWRREMSTFTYQARWVEAVFNGNRVRAITFVVDKSHQRYIGNLPIEQVAQMICTGHGVLGSCRHYFDETLRALIRLGITDVGMQKLQRAIGRIDRATVSVVPAQ